jgi:hypothetical protein
LLYQNAWWSAQLIFSTQLGFAFTSFNVSSVGTPVIMSTIMGQHYLVSILQSMDSRLGIFVANLKMLQVSFNDQHTFHFLSAQPDYDPEAERTNFYMPTSSRPFHHTYVQICSKSHKKIFFHQSPDLGCTLPEGVGLSEQGTIPVTWSICESLQLLACHHPALCAFDPRIAGGDDTRHVVLKRE